MELITLALFCLALLICIVFDASVLYALAAGLIIFCAYAKIKKHSFKAIIKMIFDGIKTSKNILIVFLIVGMLTASWRASGTIAFIICSAVKLISPSIFVLMTFLLCCGVSFLMGTSFGSAATIGVICMTMAHSMNINPVIAGGAMLSGVLFGDRCSPVSTSALLVSELTKTDIFTNIKNMFRTAAIPFVLTCVMYVVLGFSAGDGGEIPDLNSMFAKEFNLHWLSVIPAAVILILSLMKVKVKFAMLASIASALIVGITVQNLEIIEFFKIMILGFEAETQEIKHMIDGGGFVSMLNAAAIVCLSSAYSGIFAATGLLDSLKEKTDALSKKITPFGAAMVTSIFTSLISCNQTLAIILAHQLCEGNEKDADTAAIHLENSAVVISPLVPWSIAGAVPLASAGAPVTSLVAAGFLYILPIYSFITALFKSRKDKKHEQNHKFYS
ncbi:MAG: Na+/H+ antiporter NhaC family protein [Clostridia bacterium]|nr:Na+/H+ antiporter NhaC family protein [Clostridia bacterium]